MKQVSLTFPSVCRQLHFRERKPVPVTTDQLDDCKVDDGGFGGGEDDLGSAPRVCFPVYSHHH